MQNKEKLRILFITYTHSNGGGAEAVLTNLVNNLDPEKYTISVFEIVNYNVKKEPLNSNVEFLGSLYSLSNPRPIRRTWESILEQEPEIIRSLRRLDADVVITWNYQTPSFMLPAFQDKKTIAWFHGAIDDLDIFALPELRVLPYYTRLQKKAWSKAGKIITISNHSLQSLKKVFPEYCSKTSIVYNGTQVDLIHKKAADSIDFNFSRYDFPFLICMGRLDENKNFSLVIKSVAILKKQNISCGLIIIGDGKENTKLRVLSKKEGVDDKVFFLGYKQNPLPYLREAKILCVSSLSEGFPTVVTEAMALGKPFVTTPVAGASEELAYGGLCGLIAKWEPEDYAGKLQTLLSDDFLYESMSKKCIERIQKFSIHQTIFDFEKNLDGLSEKKCSNTETLSYQDAQRFFKRYYLYSFYIYKMNINKAVYRLHNISTFKNFLILIYRLAEFFIHLITTPLRGISVHFIIKKYIK